MKLSRSTIIALVLGAVALTGCEADYTNKSRKYELPPEMAHCSVYSLTEDGGTKTLTVVHCPGDETHTYYSSGKLAKQNSVIGY